MKKIHLILAGIMVLFSGVLLAQFENNTYAILSDEYDESLEDSLVIISGNLISANKQSVVFIGFQKHDEIGKDMKRTWVDDDFTWKMMIPPTKGVLYAYTVLGNEIILPVKDYKDKHSVKINFFSTDSLSPVKELEPIEIIEPEVSFKPVIYMYNDKDIKANVKFDYKGDLTFTYPKYDEDKGWNVKVKKDGQIECESNTYPYLFWEGEINNLTFNKNNAGKVPCAVVNKTKVVDYLEKELTAMGLTPKERTDFITFWAPRLMTYNEVAIQFLRNSDYSKKVSTLTVSPAPETSNRIYMLYTEVNDQNRDNFELISVKYEVSVRRGFTIVEWGGSEVKYINNSKKR